MNEHGVSRESEIKIGGQLASAVTMAGAAVMVWPDDTSRWWQAWLLGVFLFAGAAMMATTALRGAFDYWSVREKYRKFRENTGGRTGARFATDAELETAGCFEGRGRLLGMTDSGKPIFDPASATHALCLAANGRGKGICGTMPWLLALADEMKRGRRLSVVLNDPKDGEMYAQAAPLLTAMGINVVLIDDMGKFPDSVHRRSLNPFGGLIDTFQHHLKEWGVGVRETCSVLVPKPEDDRRNDYFYEQPQQRIEIALRSLATRDLPMLPAAVWELLSGSNYLTLLKCEAADGDEVLRGMCETVLGHIKSKNEHESGHMAKAIQALSLFEPGSWLHSAGRDVDMQHGDLFKQPTIVFIVGRQSMSGLAGAYYALHFNAFFKMQSRLSERWETHYLMEEANNCVIPSVPQQMTLLRQKGARITMVAQSFAALEKVYGANAVKIIDGETPVRQFLGASSFDDAKRLSEAMGKKIVIAPSVSGNSDSAKTGHSLGTTEEPLMTPEAIIGMPKDRQLLNMTGVGWVSCRTVAQNNIAPYAGQLAVNPDYGTALPVDVKIDLRARRP